MKSSIQDLIKNYKLGKLSEDDKKYLLDITNCSDIEEAVGSFEEISRYSADYKKSSHPNIELAWGKFEKNTFQKEIQEEHSEKHSFPLALSAMTLMLLIGVSLAIYFYLSGDSHGAKYIAQSGKIEHLDLADSSEITLNNAGIITVSNDYNKTDRKLRLSGEAFFQVQANKSKPFIIEVEQGQVIVVGTSFNVESNKNSDSVYVCVKTGKVKFVPKNSNKVYFIEPGYAFTFNENNGKAAFRPDLNGSAWIDKKFMFEGEGLGIVLDKISKVYKVKYKLQNEDMKNCRFTGSFENYSIEQIHEVLKTSMNINFLAVNDSVFEIEGKSCQ